MKFIDKELIQKELQGDIDNGFIFTYKKLSNKFLNWLFRHYYCVEECENFYDSEPLDYSEWKKLQETSEGISKLAQAYRDYEPERIKFCNWQEPQMEGNWGITQENVDKYAKIDLKDVRNIPDAKKDRIYFAQKDDEIRIYIYSRDLLYHDLWFIFKKRNKVKH